MTRDQINVAALSTLEAVFTHGRIILLTDRNQSPSECVAELVLGKALPDPIGFTKPTHPEDDKPALTIYPPCQPGVVLEQD